MDRDIAANISQSATYLGLTTIKSSHGLSVGFRLQSLANMFAAFGKRRM